MNRYIIFFLIFAICFVSIPYVSTLRTKEKEVFAESEPTETEPDEAEEITRIICAMSDVLKSKESIKAVTVALYTDKLRTGILPVKYGSTSKETFLKTHSLNEYGKIYDAVASVYGQAVYYGDCPIDARMHYICSGKTENAADENGDPIPYLKTVKSDDGSADGYMTTVDIPSDELKDKLKNTAELNGEPSQWIKQIKRTEAGAVRSLKVGETTLSGEQLRSILEMRSPCFSYRIKDGVFTFTVKGYGDQIGMSIYGAEIRAQQGEKYEDILKYYYNGIEVKAGS